MKPIIGRTWIKRTLAVATAACLSCCAFALADKPDNPGGGGGGGGGSGGNAAYTIVAFLPPGADWASIHSLNDVGNAVGAAGLADGPILPVHLNSDTGVYTTLMTGVYENTSASDVNNLNQIVGTTEDGNGNAEGLFWSAPSAVPTALPPLPGDVSSFAQAINDDGHIAGISINAQDVQRAVVWRVVVDGSGNVQVDDPLELTPLAAGTASWATDITQVLNGSAIVAGNTLFSPVGEEATVWSIEVDPVDGSVTAPDAPAGLGTLDGQYSRAARMNNLGDVAGESADTWPVVAPFGQAVELLPVVRNTVGGSAHDVNDALEIVGTLRIFSKRHNMSSPYACLWKNGEPIVLEKQIDGNSGWDRLSWAWVINDQGVIGGEGQLDGHTQSFILIPSP